MSSPATEAPTVPEWAEKTMRALGDASIYSRGKLTAAEESLLDAAWLLLRDRFGRTQIGDVHQATQFLICNAQAALDADRPAPETTTASGDPAPKAAEQAHINP